MIKVNNKNLEAEMKRRGVSRKDVANLLELSYSTIHSRFNGILPWSYEECVTIQQELFPDSELKYLFQAENATYNQNTCSIK